MSKDTCIKANTYCPVHKGIVGADCWHDAKDFSVPRPDWKLVDELHRLRAENAALVKQNQKMQAALKLALPCVERARNVEDCSYGRNFSEHRRDLAHKRFDAVKESIELPDLATSAINQVKVDEMRGSAESMKQLMDFYDVDNQAELIQMMEKHIGKLQKKLQQFMPQLDFPISPRKG